MCMCVCKCVCICMHVCGCEDKLILISAGGGQKRALGPLEKKLQVIISYLHEFWGPNSGILEKQQVILSILSQFSFR